MLKNKAHDIRCILYVVSPPSPVYYTDSGFDNDHSEDSNRKQAHQSHTPHYEK
jgi:hypothetical protein